jgi:hypothetical protein
VCGGCAVRTVHELDGRDGWVLDGTTAVYRPAAGDWTARVMEIAAERATRRWHCAILRGGQVVHFVQLIDPVAAAEWAERWRPPAGRRRAS